MKYAAMFFERFFHFVPAIIFYFIYSTIPALPFVEVSPWAWFFVGALALAGLFLFVNSYIGVIIGILSCVAATIADYINSGSIESMTITICIAVCIYYLFCAWRIHGKK